jgi:hypothetical protein
MLSDAREPGKGGEAHQGLGVAGAAAEGGERRRPAVKGLGLSRREVMPGCSKLLGSTDRRVVLLRSWRRDQRDRSGTGGEQLPRRRAYPRRRSSQIPVSTGMEDASTARGLTLALRRSSCGGLRWRDCSGSACPRRRGSAPSRGKAAAAIRVSWGSAVGMRWVQGCRRGLRRAGPGISGYGCGGGDPELTAVHRRGRCGNRVAGGGG